MFWGFRHAPILRKREPSVTKFGTPNDAHTVWPKATIFGVVIMWGGAVYRSQTRPIPVAEFQRLQNFGTLTYAHTVWPRATIFGMIIHTGNSVFLGGQSLLKLGDERPSVPKILGPPIYAKTARETATNFCTVINGVGTNFGVGVGEARPEGPRAGCWGSWRGDS